MGDLFRFEVGVPVQEAQVRMDTPVLQFGANTGQGRRHSQVYPGRCLDDVLAHSCHRVIAQVWIQLCIGRGKQIGEFVGGEPSAVAAALAFGIKEVGQDAGVAIAVEQQEQVVRAGGGQVDQRREFQQLDFQRDADRRATALPGPPLDGAIRRAMR